MPNTFDPYRKWLGIPPEEQPPHHYRLLGLGLFEDDPDVVEAAADRQMAHIQTYKTGPHSALSQRLLNELAAAKLCLLTPRKKADYDAALRTAILGSPHAAPPDRAPRFSDLLPPSTATVLGLAEIPATRRNRPARGSPVKGIMGAAWRRLRPRRLPLAIAGMTLLAILLGGALWVVIHRDPPERVAVVRAPSDATNAPVAGDAAVVAPDSTGTGDSKFFALKSKSTGEGAAGSRRLMESRRYEPPKGPVLTMDVSPDKSLLLAAGRNGIATVWDLKTHRRLHAFEKSDRPLRAAAISPDGRYGLTAGDDGRLRYWELRMRRLISAISIDAPQVNAAAFLPDGTFALTAGSDGKLVRWNLTNGVEVGREPLPGNAAALAISPRGEVVACLIADALRVIRYPGDGVNFSTAPVVKDFQFTDGDSQGVCLAFSGDGRSLLMGFDDGKVRVFDLTTEKETVSIEAHAGAVNSVAFSADGKFAVTGGGDRPPTERETQRRRSSGKDYSVRVWDLSTRQEVARFAGHAAAVRKVVPLSGPYEGVSCGDDGFIRFWRPEPTSASDSRPTDKSNPARKAE